MTKDTINSNKSQPVALADELSSLLSNLDNDEDNNDEQNSKYRDLDIEKNNKTNINSENPDTRDEIKGNTRKELTTSQARANIKKLKQNKKNRAKIIERSIKKRKKEREQKINHLLSKTKGSLLGKAKEAFDKLAAYKMHAKRAPGSQAGGFDRDQASKKRTLQHSLDSPTLVVKEVSQTVDGITITGKVSSRIEEGSKASMNASNNSSIEVSATNSRGQDVSNKELGQISHDAIMRNITPPTLTR